MRPLPKQDAFIILLADLGGDDANAIHGQHLADVLRQMGGFRVVRIGKPLADDPTVGDQTEARLKALKEAQRLLAADGADILIWGKYYEGSFQLGLVPRINAEDTKAGPGLADYEIKTLTVPAALAVRLRDLLELTILASIRPATEESGTYLAARLRPLVPRLEAYLRGAGDLPPEQSATAWHSLGLAQYTIGLQAGDNEALEQAIRALGKALERTPREARPIIWAATQNNLGAALATLGERESGTKQIERLEEAVQAFQEALTERTRQRAPLDWAATQNNLGNTLRILGEREGGTKRLEEAVQAFQEALTERTRQRVPLDWAMTQNNLGAALRALGERENSTERLKEAVRAFQEALKEYTRQRVPLDWAMTQNNLGNALWALAEKRRDAAQARAALGHFEAALEVYSQAAPYYREGVEGNMRNLRALIQELEKGR